MLNFIALSRFATNSNVQFGFNTHSAIKQFIISHLVINKLKNPLKTGGFLEK